MANWVPTKEEMKQVRRVKHIDLPYGAKIAIGRDDFAIITKVLIEGGNAWLYGRRSDGRLYVADQINEGKIRVYD